MSAPTSGARQAYLMLLKVLPDACERPLRSAATWVRVIRQHIRVIARRIPQQISSQVGKLWMSSAGSPVLRAAHTAVKTAATTGTSSGTVQRGRRWLLEQAPGVRWLLRPMMQVPGSGPVVLVDARQMSITEIIPILEAAGVAHRWRAVVVTDDPLVAPLRSSGLVYEYLPAIPAEYCENAHSPEFIERRRMRRFRANYRPSRVTSIADLATTVADLNLATSR